MLRVDPVQLSNSLLQHLILLLVVSCLWRKQMLVVMCHDALLKEVKRLRLYLWRYVTERQFFGVHEVSESSVAVLNELGNSFNGCATSVSLIDGLVKSFDDDFEVPSGLIGNLE